MAATPDKTPPTGPSNTRTVIFMVVLSFICALILSALASALKEPQEMAKEFDRSKQMLIAARIVNPEGYFQIETPKGEFISAKYDQGKLVPSQKQIIASQKEVLEVYRKRIFPFLVDNKGKASTFAEAGLNEHTYTQEYRKTGYYRQPFKLIYKILSNPTGESKSQSRRVCDPGQRIWPLGCHLRLSCCQARWRYRHRHLLVRSERDTRPWRQHRRTRLAKSVSREEIFQSSPDGKTDFKTAPLGITVVKGKVSEIYGSSPKAKSAVDGMAGATLTGNGVTDAYRDVLAAYRPFSHTNSEG